MGVDGTEQDKRSKKANKARDMGGDVPYNRLDNGSFQWPRNGAEARLLTHEQYIWLLQGLSTEQPKAIKQAPKRDVI